MFMLANLALNSYILPASFLSCWIFKKINQISIKDKYQDFTIISLTQTRVLLGKQGVPYKNEQIVQIYIRYENHVPCSWNSAATVV